ncbi:MAG: hypothetical protein ACJAWL_001922 [Motiliproteus sp.]
MVRFSAQTVTSGRAINILERLIGIKQEQIVEQEQAAELPPMAFEGALGDLVMAIGVNSALTLTRRLGGNEYYVPKVPKPGHPLTLALGVSVCNRLCAHYAGTRIDIPSKGVFREQRDRIITKALGRGVDQNVLAAQYGLTCRHIRNIRAQRGVSSLVAG